MRPMTEKRSETKKGAQVFGQKAAPMKKGAADPWVKKRRP
jgi:hypothetical protein